MAKNLKRLLHKPDNNSANNRQNKRSPFLLAWARAPLKIGAVAPSSKNLSRAMARQVRQETEGMVIELGAGTGPVTHALLEANIPPQRLLVVEREPSLFNILRSEFPDITIARADAANLNQVLEEQNIDKICAVVSSLPLLSMPKGIRTRIEMQMAASIDDNGCIVQFTYSLTSPIPRNRWRSLRIYGKRQQFIVTNVPPAHVWVYKRDRRIKKRASGKISKMNLSKYKK